MSSPIASPSPSLSSLPSAATTPVVGTVSAKQFVWQVPVYLVVVLVIVATVVGTILLIWNDNCISSTRSRRRVKMESMTSDSALQLPSASTFVQRMLHYFFASFWPAFQHVRQATASSLGNAAPRPQPAPLPLPLFRPPGFQEPVLIAPRPAMARDTSSFRIPSNPYSGSEPSSLPTSPSLAVFAGSVSAP
ncbi:hypothetical protein BJV74DRAFT_953808 [Russula compacta]|nr:hypothetical protein BJV74DRAFT_953808 [Russula compacta]